MRLTKAKNSRSFLKKVLMNLILLGFGFVLFFCMLEVGLRLAYPMTLEATIYHENFSYVNIPNWHGTFRNPQFLHTEYAIDTTYNSLGFNDDEINVSSVHDSNEYVILAIGDSFTYGSGVPRNESFPSIIEQNLSDVIVINMGTPSYSLDTYLNVIKYKAAQFNPDLIVIGFYVGNDINGADLYVLENNSLKQTPIPEQSSYVKLRRFILRHSHAYAFLLKAVDSTVIGDVLREKGIFFTRILPLHESVDTYTQRKSIAEKLIVEIQKESQSIDADVLFVMIPFREQVDDGKFNAFYGQNPPLLDRYVFQDDFSMFFQNHGIAYINPLDTYRKLNKNNTFYYTYDGHFNKNGYALLGTIVADRVTHIREMQNNG